MKHDYTGGCLCESCQEEREYHRVWQRERRQGRKRTVDASDAIAHIHFLRGRGMSNRAIEAAAGVGNGSVSNITKRGNNSCWSVTADRICAVTPGLVTPGHLTGAAPTIAIIGAMKKSGLTQRRISEMAGRSESWTDMVLRQTQVSYGTSRRIRVLYELLSRQGIVPASVLEEVS